MIRALHTAASGLEAQQLNIDVIANNLANVNTTSFKKSRVDFQDLMYQTLKAPGGLSPDGAFQSDQLQIGLGVRPAGTKRLFTQGGLHQTEHPLDLAVHGEGFFPVTGLDGSTLYTRDGSFQIDSEGRLTTSEGLLLEASLNVPQEASEIRIHPDGLVTVRTGGDAEPVEAGRIEIARFATPAGLEAVGSNLYRPTAASGYPHPGTPGADGLGTIRQGFLEMSNVQVVEEMVKMITAQRAFEVNSKVIEAADELLRMANGLRV